VLAVVEHDEHFAVGDMGGDRFPQWATGAVLGAQGRRHRMGYQLPIRQPSQLDQPHAIGNPTAQQDSRFEREARLAAPAWSGQCEQAMAARQADDLTELTFAAHETRELQGQVLGPPSVVAVAAGRRCRLGGLLGPQASSQDVLVQTARLVVRLVLELAP
jgi:hypothetical protein